MIDTIKLGWTCEPGGVDLSHLTGARQTQRDDGTASYSGGLRSLNVWIKVPPGGEHWRTVVTGSLTRFHKGTNALDFTWAEAAYALGDLEEALDVDLGRASVTRLDLAANLQMDRPPANYLSTTTSISGGSYEPSYYPGQTVQFRNTLRTISLYDKAREIGRRGGHVPPEVADAHVLRCEVQYRSLRKQMKQAVTVDALRSPRFAERATRLWEEHVGKVRIWGGVQFDHSRWHCPSDLSAILLREGLERVGGLGNWASTLASMPDESVSPQNRYRHIKKLHDLPRFTGGSEGDSMDQEFRRKVHGAVSHHLANLP